MPHMYPMMWLSIYMFTIMIFLIMNILTYFSESKLVTPHPNNKINNFLKKLKW